MVAVGYRAGQLRGRLHILEDERAGGEAVDEVVTADRAEFAGREEAGERHGARFRGERAPISGMTLACPLVMTNGDPTGRQPCETTLRIATLPRNRTPTAPTSTTSSPKMSGVCSGSLMPLAMPPWTRSPL